MALRMSPTNKRDKERLRQLQLRREKEQDRTRLVYSIPDKNTKGHTELH